MKVLDLFSGIGGFSLGLERAGFETVAFCEIDKHAQQVLRKHWPQVPIYEDVRGITHARLTADGVPAIDVVTGGFPCQDVSSAGRQAGITGEKSGLWGELCRIIGELRPKYATVENVSNLLAGESGLWFGRVLGDLAEIGFDAIWHCIPAAYVGAPHSRDRVWIVAYPKQGLREGIRLSNSLSVEKLENRWEASEVSSLFRCIRDDCQTDRYSLRSDDGFSETVDRLERCGNSVVPSIPEMIGRAIMAADARVI